jgi:hypothetical protein
MTNLLRTYWFERKRHRLLMLLSVGFLGVAGAVMERLGVSRAVTVGIVLLLTLPTGLLMSRLISLLSGDNERDPTDKPSSGDADGSTGANSEAGKDSERRKRAATAN